MRSDDDCLVSFPWYDTYGEFKYWADAILKCDEPRVFWDADQSWELEAWKFQDHFYFRCGDPDDQSEEPRCYRFPKMALRAYVEQLNKDCVATLQQLSNEVGIDFFEIDKSLKLLDAKVLQSGSDYEPKGQDQPTKAHPWWRLWK
jgi:hypothetical protein